VLQRVLQASAAMPVPLVALRFARLVGGGHVDLATGARVALRTGVVAPSDRIAFDEIGNALMRLWHPGLAPYLDYGPLGADEWFEASSLEEADPVHACVSEKILADAIEILPLAGARGATVAAIPGSEKLIAGVLGPELEAAPAFGPLGATRHCAGMRLIHRPLMDRLIARLDDPMGDGAALWRVAAERGTGWRTCWRFMARALRQSGFIPVSAALLERVGELSNAGVSPWLATLENSTLVVAAESDDEPEEARVRLSALLLALGMRPGRAIVIHVRRHPGESAPADTLEPLSSDRLAAAVVSAGPAPTLERLRRIARRAGGRPGDFSAALVRMASADRRPFQVHDGGTAGSSDGQHEIPPMFDRTRALAARGRRGDACRLLRKQGGERFRRGDLKSALRTWAELAIACAASGRHDEAERAWRDAWQHAVDHGDLSAVVHAAPTLANAWIADLAPARAERLLRSVLAAPLPSAEDLSGACGHLAESLWWQARWREALVTADGVAGCHAACVRGWSYLALGETARALSESAAAADQIGSGDACVDRLLALETRLQVDVAAGDGAHAELVFRDLEETQIARDDWACKRDLVLAEALVVRGRPIPENLRRRLGVLIRARGPRLVRARARVALSLDSPAARSSLEAEVRRVALATGARALLPAASYSPWPWPRLPRIPRSPMVHDIVEMLQLCQRDADPELALRGLCALVSERATTAGTSVLAMINGSLAVLGRAGRPPALTFAERAEALGVCIGPESSAEGFEAAWPIRQGQEVIGVLACRWGSSGSPTADAIALLQAAAAAVAPLVALARSARASAVPAARGPGEDLIGSSGAMSRVRAAIERAGPSPFPVLIEGESGAGKELVARAIHARSTRRARHFAALNCAALADDLIEAELFGHARGAFTGAIAERAGLFEEADGGTLFLDEVGELSPRAQAKLLRAIQEGEIRRIGETRSRRVDARIVAATNRSLESEAAAGRFRMDLRFRLDVVRIEVPPLRGRPEDIAELAQHFWQQAAARVGSRAVLGREALAALARHDWPGNVRELQNVLAAVAVAAPRRGTLGPAALPAGIGQVDGDALTLDEARRRFDAGFVRGALARAGGCRSRAASELGLSRQGLSKLMERLGIATPTDTIEA
jgi:DNA-binding NtrC family response regulator